MTHDAERWLPIPGLEGRYEVSDLGCVRTARRSNRGGPAGRLMRLSRDTGGYLHVALLADDGSRPTPTIHKLVLTTFVGPRPEGMCCRHLDGNQLNNHLSNLAWGTAAENAADRKRHGRTVSKLCGTDVEEIKRRVQSGSSQADVAAHFGVHQSSVSLIMSGKTWKVI